MGKCKKVLLVGATGMLGRAMKDALKERKFKILEPLQEKFDITDQELVLEYLRHNWPDIVINCAGVTDIEENEDEDELWPELVNFYGPTVLANLAKDMGLKLVSFSCQQVFDGHAREPYDEGDTVAPLNTYGKYKAEAEKVVLSYCPTALIVRTSLLFGPGRTNFVSLVARKSQMDEEIELPADVFINPSYTVDVARAVVQLLEKDAGGIVHVVNSGEATERELAREVFRMLDMDVDVSETGEALLTGPKLPPRALLGTKKLNSEYGIKLRSWKDALRDYIRKHKDTDILLSDDIAEADTPEEQE